jgi:uncharacterized protein
MLITLNDVPEEGRDYEGTEPRGIFEIGDDDNVKLKESVSYRLRAIRGIGALYVNGTVWGDVAFRCSRCDKWFTQAIEANDFVSAWNLADDGRTPPERAEGGVENIKEKGKKPPRAANSAKDACLESVDLTGDIRESMILAFPHYPVCDSACKGMCPQCGTNLNQKECNCQPPTDDRWVGLDGLKLKEEP